MTEKFYNDISLNLSIINKKITAAAKKSGRSRDDITLLAVTKTIDAIRINEAMASGIDVIGENYVSEITDKIGHLPGNVNLHMIGHLQTNKIKTVLPHISMLQSLDSLHLAKKLQNELCSTNSSLDVLIEVNIGDEIQKSGVSPEKLEELTNYAISAPNIILRGFMCIPPPGNSIETKKYFAKMFNLYIDIRAKKRDNINIIDILSMGMSNDYEIAIIEGANLVRIGSAIFGDRKNKEI